MAGQSCSSPQLPIHMGPCMTLVFAVFAVVTLVIHQSVAPSPDAIVFVCHRDGADNVCITNSSGDHFRQITSATGEVDGISSPRWSPGRGEIAFDYQLATREGAEFPERCHRWPEPRSRHAMVQPPRQPERRQVRGLGADAAGIGCSGLGQGMDVLIHEWRR